MTGDEQGYNGWKNYETWSVALIVDNDEDLYNARRYRVEAVAREADEGECPSWSTPAEHRRYEVADHLKSWIENLQPEIGDGFDPSDRWAYLWSQLIGAALSEVDWEEIADAWLEDYVPEEADDAEAR